VNYYPRYPAHYVAKTLHLSMEQDGAYTRLLDWYYANERPIPHAQRYAISRAQTPSERRSTDTVLGEFFGREGEAWRQGRTDDEIADAQPKIEAARANGKKGGRPKVNPVGSVDKPSGFPIETQVEPTAKTPQSPISIESSVGKASASTECLQAPTEPGRACLLMRGGGCIQTNPSHPDLLAALSEGVTPEALSDTVLEAIAAGKKAPFLWAIQTARGRHAAGPASAPQGRGQWQPPAPVIGGSSRQTKEQALAPMESRLKAQLRWLRGELDAGRMPQNEYDTQVAAAREKLSEAA
jgi:uncharacterized protein YdaU (DUF1376 family)